MVTNAFLPSAWEAGEFLWSKASLVYVVPGRPELHIKTLSQKQNEANLE